MGRLKVIARWIGWTVATAAGWGACALVVLAAAGCTRGAGHTDRGTAVVSPESGWEITSFDGSYEIDAQGAVHVEERIAVDFHGLQKHGIFRDLFWRVDCQPPRVTNESKLTRCPLGQLRTYEIAVSGVTAADGTPWTYEVSRMGDTERIKIGDPFRTVSGPQSYVIRYTVGRALDAYANHDELYWNLSGAWPVPVASFSLKVNLPSGAMSDVRCFVGPYGSKESCPAAIGPEGAAGFQSGRKLGEREQVTVVAAFPRGAVAVPSSTLWHESSLRDFYTADVWEAAGGVFVGLLVAAGLLAIWWGAGRDRQYRTIY